MALRVYTVHVPPPFSGRGQDIVVLREGFNWLAFLFGGLWALAQRMWLLGALLLVLTGAVTGLAAAAELGSVIEAVLSLAVAIVIGAEANDWRRAHLARKGWIEAAVIAAADEDAALRRYADLKALAAPAPPPPRGLIRAGGESRNGAPA